MKVLKDCSKRTFSEQQQLTLGVADIIQNVRQDGDAALVRYNETFDGNNRTVLKVLRDEIVSAYANVEPGIIEDMKCAANNIRAFAKAQRASCGEELEVEVYPGVYLGHRKIPVNSCCCYVPGGSYPLFSTALMLSIPAKEAGVKRVAACSPTMRNTSNIHPLTLVALDIAGVDEIYAMGGAHAIAAFAYGTQSVEAVDIIVGPGNRYVTEAKRQCYGQVGIDFVAGPSEVLVISDNTGNAEVIAADLLGQSEHDVHAKGIFVTTDESLGHSVIDEVEKQLVSLSTQEIARVSWMENGEVLLVDTLSEAAELSNRYAPEHLEVIAEEEQQKVLLGQLNNYGSLFVGGQSAEVFGDYVSGTNHTLPTLRASRYTGGVWVGTYLKTCTHQRMSPEGTASLAPIAARLARAEGLEAHARAAEIRIKPLT